MELSALEKQLRGELEWIPLKALRKDRTQRYSTANELADDVRNYLDNRPLVAGPESAAYRAKKFLRRNKRTVSAAAAVLVVLVAGIIVSTWQAVRIAVEQKNTLAQKQEADRQREVATVNLTLAEKRL